MEESIEKTKGLKGLFTGCESGLLYEVEFSGIKFFEEENFILDVISYPKSFLLDREKLNFELETFGVERVSGQCFIGGWEIPGKRLSFHVIGQPVFSHAAVTGVVDPEPSVQHTKTYTATHPLDEYWKKDSGWCDEMSPTPQEGLAEGNLSIETWNRAIDAAIENHSKGKDISELYYNYRGKQKAR